MGKQQLPIIGVTADVCDGRLLVARGYLAAVARAGGCAIVIGPGEMGDEFDAAAEARAAIDICDGFVLTGGGDPATEPFPNSEPTHPAAQLIDPARQAYEMALLNALLNEDTGPGKPVLGVCLGMQLMALVAGGRLHQHLPEVLPTASDHAADRTHPVRWRGSARDELRFSDGAVASRHHQAVADPGRLEVIATAHDGVIEAVRDPARPWAIGVQWHPERTVTAMLGQALFAELVRAAAAATRQ